MRYHLAAIALLALAPCTALAGETLVSEDALVAAAARLQQSVVLLRVTRTFGATTQRVFRLRPGEIVVDGRFIRTEKSRPTEVEWARAAEAYDALARIPGGSARGFFVGDGKSILTAADVVDGAAKVEVVTASGPVEAIVTGLDRDFGVALLKAPVSGPALDLEAGAELERGRLLVIDGAANGGRGVDVLMVSMRIGEVARRGCARLGRAMPAEAIGSPALGPDGRVRGIVVSEGGTGQYTTALRDVATHALKAGGVTWANEEDVRAHPWMLTNQPAAAAVDLGPTTVVVPGRRVARALKDLLESGRVRKSYMGLVLGAAPAEGQPIDERRVARVLPGAPAEGKVLTGDRIVAVGERTLLATDDVSYEILALEPGVATTLTVERKTEAGTTRETVSLTPTERKEDAFQISSASFGFETVPLTPELRAWTGYSGDGLVVASVVPGGVADRAGLKRGDRLVRFAAREIRSTDDLVPAVEDALRAVAASQPVTLEVTRDGAPKTLTLFAR